jgi:hypothetical protein
MSPVSTLRSPRGSRGQALVLSALGMVLLVLMVCMTLSFGTRAKAKMEVQIVADQAAYSTAVAVARTYNVLALTNRVMMAHMTAMLGIQSAISFSSIWYAMVFSAALYYAAEIINQDNACDPCPFCPTCWMVPFVQAWIVLSRLIPTGAELLRVVGLYGGLDTAAASQADRTGLASLGLYVGQVEAVSNRLFNAVNNQGIAQNVLSQSSANMQLSGSAGDVARREAGFPTAFPVAGISGGINQTMFFLSDRHAVMAAMGARGHPFTANRFSFSFLPNSVDSMLSQAESRGGNRMVDDVTYVNMGNAYFGGNNNVHENTMLTTQSTLAMSDDHGQGIISYSDVSAYPPMTWPLLLVALVQSNVGTGFHAGGFGLVLEPPFPNGIPIPIIFVPIAPLPHWTHTVTACTTNCPSAWSSFVDYNLLKVPFQSDNYAQPKLPVTIYKDATLQPKDPFNLMFNMRFSSTGPGTEFNLQNGSQSAAGVGGAIMIRDGAGAADISRQVGYSTGITYYHRAGHWKEPPNLFNPYWRAGITRADTDRRSDGSDIETVLDNTGASWARRSFDSLLGVGFKGTP